MEIGPFLPSGALPQKHQILDEPHWSRDLPSLGHFDLILCREAAPNLEHKKKTVEMGHLLLQEGKKVLKSVAEAVPEITKIRYADKDLEAFCEEVGQFYLHHLSRFLTQLRQNGQISQEQHERMIQKYHLDKTEVELETFQEPSTLLPLIQECLKNHMRAGSKLICFLSNNDSKYEDPQFFDQIITNPTLDYQEKKLHLGTEEFNILLIEKIA